MDLGIPPLEVNLAESKPRHFRFFVRALTVVAGAPYRPADRADRGPVPRAKGTPPNIISYHIIA